MTRVTQTIKLVSLLQPPPETVALFDELILLGEGKIIYNGPIEEVVDYFNALGYEIPERMDVADWLQALPTKDGEQFLIDKNAAHLSTEGFAKRFNESPLGEAIFTKLEAPMADGSSVESLGATRYRNSPSRSLKLLVRRELLLWWRDKYQIQATVMKGATVLD